LIGKGILQCSIAYPDLHQIKRNDTHQSAISGEHPLKTSGLSRSGDATSRRPRREDRHRKVRKKKARDNKRSAANGPVDESYFWHHYTNFMTRYG
jgi:hypothetical protein